MTLVTFSANEVNVELPKGWRDLTQDELTAVYTCLELYDGEKDDARLQILLRLASISVMKDIEPIDGRYKCTISDGHETRVLWIDPKMLLAWLDELDWIYDPGDTPVRLDKLHGVEAISAMFRNLPFEDYLKVENLYQAFLATKNTDHIKTLERILYPGSETDDDTWIIGRTLNIVNWVTQVKAMFAKMFCHLFKSADSDEMPNMIEIVNNQVRALTGGDITKEQAVLSIDCWRALTELDYKAKEADELNEKLKKNGR